MGLGQDSAHILVVDDDQDFRGFVAEYLEEQGMAVHCADNGTAMRETIETQPIDLILLDLIMPDEDGLALTRYLRQRSEIGIIILSGGGDKIDRIVGIELGADDYLAKPFEPRELLARIRGVLRRIKQSTATPAKPPRRARFDGWTVDFQSLSLQAPDGRTVSTTSSEFALIGALVKNPNRVLDRDELLNYIKGRETAAYERVIDVLVFRLRQKLKAASNGSEYIRTVHGQGYMFCADVAFEQ